MSTLPKEYSLAELIEHPALGLMMVGDGIDERSLGLLLDGGQADRRPKPVIPDQPIVE